MTNNNTDAKYLALRFGQSEDLMAKLLIVLSQNRYAELTAIHGFVDFTIEPDNVPKLMITENGINRVHVVTEDSIDTYKITGIPNCLGLLTMKHQTSLILKAGIYDEV